MATTPERDILANQILAAIGANHTKLKSNRVTAFLSMEGHCSQQRELMVIGRSVNGWIPGVSPATLATPGAALAYASQILQSVNGNGKTCPMMWVSNYWGATTGYNTKRSAFWRAIREVVGRLSIANVNAPDWPSYLVWSNLYKIAPETGGNPGSRLGTVQLPGCLALFQLELATYLPKRLLFLTGMDWATPFITSMTINKNNPGTLYVERYGQGIHSNGQNFQFVVASHPQGKPLVKWVQEVGRVL